VHALVAAYDELEAEAVAEKMARKAGVIGDEGLRWLFFVVLIISQGI
jgi:hypothetical protein